MTRKKKTIQNASKEVQARKACPIRSREMELFAAQAAADKEISRARYLNDPDMLAAAEAALWQANKDMYDFRKANGLHGYCK
jgi:hypothetical protein